MIKNIIGIAFAIYAVFLVISIFDKESPSSNTSVKAGSAGSSSEQVSVREYDPANNPKTWTSPIQGGQNFFNINSEVAGDSRLSLIINSSNCHNVQAVWGYGLIMNKEVFNINGTNVTVRQSGVSILGMPFLQADTTAGAKYVLEQVLQEKPLVVKTDGVALASDETVITTDSKKAYEAIVGFCTQRKKAQERAL